MTLSLLEALFETAMQLPFGISGKIFSRMRQYIRTHAHKVCMNKISILPYFTYLAHRQFSVENQTKATNKKLTEEGKNSRIKFAKVKNLSSSRSIVVGVGAVIC